MRHPASRAIATLVVFALTACGPTYGMDTAGRTRELGSHERAVRRRAARDFFCPEEQVGVDGATAESERYRAAGCGRSAEYRYGAHGLERATEVTQSAGASPPLRRPRH